MEVVEEIATKYVPEDVLTNVSWSSCIVRGLSSLTLSLFTVHDPHHVHTFLALAHAQAVCSADRVSDVPVTRRLLQQQDPEQVPLQSANGNDVHERGDAG